MQDIYDNKIWVNKNFGNVDLGDKRRSQRANQIALNFLEKPHESIPKQMKTWSEVKGAYRFFNNPSITYDKIQSIHKERTINDILEEEVVLFPQDTTEIAFTCDAGMGSLGYHKGMLAHSCLAITIKENQPQVIGLASQKIWTRKTERNGEAKSERYKRKRESSVWLETLKSIGKPSNKWVSIGDRGNDIFEFMDGAKTIGFDFVIRAAQNRAIEGEDEEYSLSKIRAAPPVAKTLVEMRRSGDSVNRLIELSICFSEVNISPPARLKNKDSCKVFMIRCFNDAEKIEWILYSSLPVKTVSDAVEKCFWYSCRWIIEEYHKCLKTGCKLEKRQLKTEKGLKTVLGMLSVIATKLLHLKGVSRLTKNVLAKEEVPAILIKVVCRKYRLDESELTLKEFWRRVAMYGGFLGRKSDGNPGWQTIWKGWMDLLAIYEGFEIAVDIMKAI